MITGPSCFVLFALFAWILSRDKGQEKMPPKIEKPIALYVILGILFCHVALSRGIKTAGFLLDVFPAATVFGWVAVCASATYTALFFRSLCRMAALRPGALRLARCFMFSVLPFILGLPLFFFVLYAACTDGEYDFILSLRLYKWMADDPFPTIMPSSLFSLCWLLYFGFSSDMKRLWAAIDSGDSVPDKPE